MKIEKNVDVLQGVIQNLEAVPDNLMQAFIKLLEITHNNGLDEEVRAALLDCGITLDIEQLK